MGSLGQHKYLRGTTNIEKKQFSEVGFTSIKAGYMDPDDFESAMNEIASKIAEIKKDYENLDAGFNKENVGLIYCVANKKKSPKMLKTSKSELCKDIALFADKVNKRKTKAESNRTSIISTKEEIIKSLENAIAANNGGIKKATNKANSDNDNTGDGI